MTEEKKLLSKATKKFTDTKNKVYCYSASIINHNSGVNYILLDKDKMTILDNIAINNFDNRDMTSAGQLDYGEYTLQTPQNLFNLFKVEPELIVLNYKTKYFTVHSQQAFNSEEGSYHYRAEILQSRNKNYIIYDISDIKQNILNNSIPLWIYNKDRIGLPIYPSYLSPINYTEPFISVDVLNTRGLCMVKLEEGLNEGSTLQWKGDDIRLYIINASTELQQSIAYKIQTLSINYNNNVFGVQDFINFKSLNDDRQKGFGIITNKVCSDFRINYYQETSTDIKVEELIKTVIVQVNNNDITLYNRQNILDNEENNNG